ncbi:MAG: hypothetical protein BRD45_02595 [Bacteroidetes bacterium QS_8_64_10]|nr:MAG: hypothetical protein BRD45_02595 [Bacteroidetes bacterium QS_8_64_10]
MRFLFCQNCSRAVARNGSTTAVIALWALLAAPAAFGQGSISGTVTDAETGDPLIGVNLIVKGTTQGAATGVDGNYTISGLDASEYTVKVTYVGFETKQITGVAVEDGETTTLDVELSEAVLSTEEEVTVVGENPLINVEQSASVQTVDAEQIETAPRPDGPLHSRRARQRDGLRGGRRAGQRSARGHWLRGGPRRELVLGGQRDDRRHRCAVRRRDQRRGDGANEKRRQRVVRHVRAQARQLRRRSRRLEGQL